MPIATVPRITFPRHRDSGPMVQIGIATFPKPITSAIAVLTGTKFGFSPRNDHNLGEVEISLQADVLPPLRTSVQVIVRLGVRDWSGEWDDDYEGWVDCAVIAE